MLANITILSPHTAVARAVRGDGRERENAAIDISYFLDIYIRVTLHL